MSGCSSCVVEAVEWLEKDGEDDDGYGTTRIGKLNDEDKLDNTDEDEDDDEDED